MRSLWQALLVLGTCGSAAFGQERPRFVNPAALPLPRGYTHVVEVPAGQRLVFISGQVALDRGGKLVGAGNVRTQTEQVFANLQAALGDVGATWSDVVKLTIYLVDVGHIGALREVRDRYVNPAAPPASSLVEVSRLFREDLLVEVEAIAAVQSR